MSNFTNDEILTLSHWRIGAAALSCCGSISILAVYARFRSLRTEPYNYVALVSLCDIFFSAVVIWDSAKLESVPDHICTSQAVMSNFFGVASMLWTAAIASSIMR